MHDRDATAPVGGPSCASPPSGQIVRRRTPSELAERACQGKMPYNIYRLNNDNRGCKQPPTSTRRCSALAQTMHPLKPNSPARSTPR